MNSKSLDFPCPGYIMEKNGYGKPQSEREKKCVSCFLPWPTVGEEETFCVIFTALRTKLRERDSVFSPWRHQMIYSLGDKFSPALMSEKFPAVQNMDGKIFDRPKSKFSFSPLKKKSHRTEQTTFPPFSIV